MADAYIALRTAERSAVLSYFAITETITELPFSEAPTLLNILLALIDEDSKNRLLFTRTINADTEKIDCLQNSER